MIALETEPTIERLAEQMGGTRVKPMISIYQNVYTDKVRSDLDPEFIPVDGRQNANTDFRENGLVMRMYASGLYQSATYTGIVSPKFSRKTLISGKEFIQFVEDNPGYDVYFVSAFPQNIYYSFNVWHHAEICHPGITALAEILFAEAGYNFADFCNIRMRSDSTLYSNFWIGNSHFWEEYMAFLTSLMDALARLPSTVAEIFSQREPTYPDPVSYIPFILERCTSTFFVMRPDIRRKSYPRTREEIFKHLPENNGESCLVSAFADWVDAIDRERDYGPGTQQVFKAISMVRKDMGF